MLISVSKLTKILNIHPTGVVHVGAHLAEERAEYIQNHWGNTFWIDAIAQNVEFVRKYISGSGDLCVQALVWSESGIDLGFNISSNSQSSSIYDFGSHSSNYPEIIMQEKIRLKTHRLDEIIPTNFVFDFINLDIQGAELQALKGLGEQINRVNFIYTEVNKEEVYKDCAVISQIDEYLFDSGFIRVAVFWTNEGWGDAFYLRRSELNLLKYFRVILLNIAISNRNSIASLPITLGRVTRRLMQR
jgi:FkbM family methyltransferase